MRSKRPIGKGLRFFSLHRESGVARRFFVKIGFERVIATIRAASVSERLCCGGTLKTCRRKLVGQSLRTVLLGTKPEVSISAFLP